MTIEWKERKDISSEELLKSAPAILKSIKEDSPFFESNRSRNLPTFLLSELEIGPKLGTGGFCHVNEISSIKLTSEERPSKNGIAHNIHDNHYHLPIPEIRALMSSHCLRDGHARYAIKKLKPKLFGKDRVRGMIDLGIKVCFLSTVSHPNIIKLRGIADGDIIQDSFFLVLDRLYMTLEDKIKEWRYDVNRNMGCLGLGCIGVNKKELDRITSERVVVAYDLTCALKYLHEKNIIYRDIKPDNMGFDVRGDIKLFDFGLAKEIRPQNQLSSSGLYNMTGLVGARYYMAPEVLLSKPYNLLADSYSFAILMYELMSLEPPFLLFDAKDHYEKVAIEGSRLELQSSWPCRITALIDKCWNAKISDRPKFKFIHGELDQEMHSQCGQDSDIAQNRKKRKITFAYSISKMSFDRSDKKDVNERYSSLHGTSLVSEMNNGVKSNDIHSVEAEKEEHL